MVSIRTREKFHFSWVTFWASPVSFIFADDSLEEDESSETYVGCTGKSRFIEEYLLRNESFSITDVSMFFLLSDIYLISTALSG